MNKKSIGALLLSAALLIGATGSTFAYFTGGDHTDQQTITMGNVKVAFDTKDGTQWTVARRGVSVKDFPDINLGKNPKATDLDEIEWSKGNNNGIKNLAPGDVIYKTFTLRNTGSLDAKVKLYLVGADGKELPCNLNFFNFKAYLLNEDNTPGPEVGIGVYPTYVTLDAKAPAHKAVVVYVGAYMDALMDNGGQDKVMNFTLKADATQWNNPGWLENGN